MLDKSACDKVHHAAGRGASGALMDGLPPSARLVGIGFYVAICIAGCTLGGRELDGVFGTGTVLTLAGLALGLVMAIWGGLHQLFEVLAEINRRRLGGKQK